LTWIRLRSDLYPKRIRRNIRRTARRREKQYQSPGKGDSQIASQTADALRRSLRFRCRRRWRWRSAWGLSALSTCGSDLVAHLGDSGGTHLVENANHITMHGHQIRAD